MAPTLGTTLWLGLCRLSSGLPGPLDLSPQEEARLRGMAAPGRAAQYRMGRWLLRRLVAQATGLERQAIVLNAEGRPQAQLPQGVALPFLSLAHSGDWVLGAACGGPCGVDLERKGRDRDWAELACREGLKGAHDDAETPFLRHWTLKEARIKAPDPDPFAVWRWENRDYVACLVAPPGSQVRTLNFSGEASYQPVLETSA